MTYSLWTHAAVEAAQLAGAFLQEHFTSAHTTRYKEGAQNLVTECDIGAEKRIVETLQKHFPSHSFLCEESGTIESDTDVLWIIDPLDGTVNFARGIPYFSISIAAVQNRETVVGVIYQPLTQELFLAEKGKGARLGNTPLRVSTRSHLSEALLVTGFPYNVADNPGHCIPICSYFLKQGTPIRRFGSAALDLACVAAGHADAYFEIGIKPWDVAAGILLVEEAGGRASSFSGAPYPLLSAPPLLASNRALHSALIDAIQKGTPPCASSQEP